MASLRERIAARQAEKASQVQVASGGSLRSRIAARQAQRASTAVEDPRGLVSPQAAAAQVEAAQGGPPLFQMSTSGQSFVDGRPASTLDLLKGAFSGDFQVPPEPDQELQIGRQPGPLETADPLAQRFIRANRAFGEQKPIAGAPSRLLDFLTNTPEGNRLALEATGGIVAPGLLGTASLRSKAIAAGFGETAGSLVGSATVAPNEEPLTRARDAFFAGLGGEGIGGKVAETIQGGIARLRSGGFAAVPGAQEAIEQVGERATIPAGNLTTARTIDIPQKITESSVIGGGGLKKVSEQAEKVAFDDLKRFSDGFVLDGGNEATGTAAQKALDVAFDSGRAANTARYAELDEITEGVGVDVTEVLKRADEIAERADLTPGLREKAKALGNSIRQVVQPEETVGTGVFDAAGNEITRVIEANNIIPWAQAAEFRSISLKVGRDPSEFIAGEAQAVGQRLSPIIGEAMDEAMEGLGKDALPLAKLAREKYKEFAELYEDNVIQLLAKRDPDKFVRTALPKKSPGAIRRAREAVGNDQAWRAVQGQFMVDLMDKSIDPETLRPIGLIMARNIRTFGQDSLKEVFPDPQDLKTFNQFVRTLEITQQGAGKRLPGGILAQLQQAQSIQTLALTLFGQVSTSAASAASLVIAGPHLIGKLVTNPKFVRWAVIGMEAKPGSTAAARALSQMILIHDREKTIHEKRIRAERKKLQERQRNMDGLPEQRLAAPTAIP